MEIIVEFPVSDYFVWCGEVSSAYESVQWWALGGHSACSIDGFQLYFFFVSSVVSEEGGFCIHISWYKSWIIMV